MNQLKLIKQSNFGEVQADFYSNNEEVFMTANQLAKCLGYSNGRKGIDNLISRNKRLQEEKFSVTLNLRGTDDKTYKTRVFTEIGVYEVAFLSKTKQAERFRDWVSDVLKSIRKHGAYITDEVLSDPVKTNQAIDNLRKENQQLQKQMAAQKHHVEFSKTIQGNGEALLVREVAKLASNHIGVEIGEKQLYKILRMWGLICKLKNEPTSRAKKAGWIELDIRERLVNGFYVPFKTARITPKGQRYIIGRLIRENVTAA